MQLIMMTFASAPVCCFLVYVAYKKYCGGNKAEFLEESKEKEIVSAQPAYKENGGFQPDEK